MRQSRSVQVGYQNYTKGYRLSHVDGEIKGSAESFKNHRKKCLELGSQMLSIPDLRYDEDGKPIKHVENPIKKIIQPPPNTSMEYDIPQGIKTNLNAMLYLLWTRLGRKVLAVYAVKVSTDEEHGLDVMTMDEEKLQIICVVCFYQWCNLCGVKFLIVGSLDTFF